MMYTRFTFGEYKKKHDKNKHPHPYGVFEGPLGSSPKDEFGWMSKLRIQQTRLSSKLTDDSLHNKWHSNKAQVLQSYQLDEDIVQTLCIMQNV